MNLSLMSLTFKNHSSIVFTSNLFLNRIPTVLALIKVSSLNFFKKNNVRHPIT